ncbi:hypothetical protein L2E82_08463 [Cichorium intybus]|uniref:Uncharacterized protein n=1 Tax=Cichorium intybus TaxID=13427 RepID=A0ACB9G7K3_CICIN|nr:hypothetical protein L2E82_08463 [Cichorium intybus]
MKNNQPFDLVLEASSTTKSIWVALIAGGLPIWRLLRVSAVTLGGYKRRHLAPSFSVPILTRITLLDCLLHCFGCDLHLRQDTFAASFKNKIQRILYPYLMSEPSVYSPRSPPSPISESIRKHLLNMERLTGLNCKGWLRNWRRVLVIAGKLHLTEYLIPVPPKQVIIKSLYDKHDLLVDEFEKVRDLIACSSD